MASRPWARRSGHEQAIPAWLPIVVGVVAMAVFVWRQLTLQRGDRALLDLRTLTHRNYTLSVITMGIAMMSLFGTVILSAALHGERARARYPADRPAAAAGQPDDGSRSARSSAGSTTGVGAFPLLVPGTVLVSLVMWALTLVDQNTSVWAILAGHVVISIGLALTFTPLFTASLSSLPMQLYSHGSAILGSVQQVAGAAGMALFVALMTLQAGGLTAAGADTVSATVGGIHVAFLCGAVISLFAIVAALFVRKPPANPEMAAMGGH